MFGYYLGFVLFFIMSSLITSRIEGEKDTFRPAVRKCVVCSKRCSYSCPKCKKNYCSVAHYRSHNLFCSQEFYQKQVQQQLKNTKITNKEEKKEMAAILKDHYEKLGDPIIEEERLQEMLVLLENNQEVELNSKQKQTFQTYISQLQLNDENQYQPAKQFWEIDDGLSLYILQQHQLQQFTQSEHADLVLYRSNLSNHIRQFKDHHPETICEKAHAVVKYHIVGCIYLSIWLYRLLDGEVNEEMMEGWLKVFTSKSYTTLMTQTSASLSIILRTIDKELVGFGWMKHIIEGWMKNRHVLSLDLNHILKNKYLVLQLLFRIRQALPKSTSKLIKKIEYYITYIIYRFEEMGEIVSMIQCM